MQVEFPNIFAWARWPYQSARDLRFGQHHISTLSLVVLKVLDDIGNISGIQLSIWYLDDGTFIGKRLCFQFSESYDLQESSLGLQLNLEKCEISWLSGDQLFHDFLAKIIRSGSSCNGGIELSGIPLLGSDQYFVKYFSKRVDKVLKAQELLLDLNNPQVEIQLLRSCQSICKLNHLIQRVPSHMVSDQLSRFDLGMQRSYAI